MVVSYERIKICAGTLSYLLILDEGTVRLVFFLRINFNLYPGLRDCYLSYV